MPDNISVKVLSPGFLSTIQDLGRSGFQAFGVPESGAMDKEAAMTANLLVSNKETAPVIEVTVMGLELEFSGDSKVAITGGDLMPTVNGLSVPMYQTLDIAAGSRLKFSALKKGARAYLAFSGELQLKKIMNSFSTYLRGSFGGFQGRKLEKNDIIFLKPRENKDEDKYLASSLIRNYQKDTLRVYLNRDEDYFTGEGINAFLTSEYHVSPQSDRMGYRLEGALISHRKGADIISTAINFGAIQVPGHGMPIIMMADRQTVGGYTQIGRVISVDLPLLAQMLPGSKVNFKEISLRESQELYRERLKEIREALI